MTVIVCLDNANGMMFNHRRQSRDANVVKDILKTINGTSLLIAPYSEPLFSQAECSVSISDSFLTDAEANDYCFVENTSVAEFKEKISKLVRSLPLLRRKAWQHLHHRLPLCASPRPQDGCCCGCTHR